MTTLLRRALGTLSVLAVERGLDPGAATASFEGLVRPCAWPDRSTSEPRLASGLSHRQPYGFSVVMGEGHGELRALVEAQADRDDASRYWETGERMTAWIGRQPGGSLERYRAVADDFVPDACAPFRVWHGVSWSAGETRYRVYLSLRANPQRSPRARLRRALEPLGCRAAFERCEPALRAVDQPTILSLDLGAPHRVKVYVLHPDAGFDELRGLWSISGSDPGGAERFVERMSGGRRFHWLTGLTLEGDALVRVALHFGLTRRRGPPPYSADEADARIRGVAAELGVDPEPHEALRRHAGIHHFVSFQDWSGAPRLTTYFAPVGP